MKNKNRSAYYVENLNSESLLFTILPYFLKGRMSLSQDEREIHYFNSSLLGRLLAKVACWFTKIRFKRLDFSQGEAKDQDGHLIWMKTVKDILTIQEDIKDNFELRRAVEAFETVNNLHLFLGKWSISCDLTTEDIGLLQKFIFFVRIVEHRENKSGKKGFLFMQKKPWFAEIAKFVESKGVRVIPTQNFYFHVNVFFLRFDYLIVLMKGYCKRMEYAWMVMRSKFKRPNKGGEFREPFKNESHRLGELYPKIAVEQYGCLNLDSPELFSDVFFFKKSPLRAQDILIYFSLPKSPVTNKDWDSIKKCGMSAVTTNLRAAATPGVPFFNHKQRKIKVGWPDNRGKSKKDSFNDKWLHHHVSNYCRRYDYWVDFITRYNVKMHVTWVKYNPDHCAVLDALKNTGGLGVVYQRSFDHFLAPWTFTTADVVFGFSKWGAHVGRDKQSMIPYYVTVGYLGDYRFNLLRKRAHDVRDSLKSHGAERIVAYFDEHARDDQRWDLAYKVTLENYSYLLNKVLDHPWFGLILKPKVPATLRSRMGPIAELLRRAEETGRCFVFEDSGIQALCSPAVASLGADVAIHGHLFASTAGVESALAGAPTLLFDGEGIPDSPLNQLGEGRVIFKDMDCLWKTCTEHWKRPEGVPGLGDWSDMLDELDPFRDGRAAERMGYYLGWLMEGFKAGLPRETVMADAAERYSEIWGKDKILSVNSSNVQKELAPVV
jgi:hypothetical protein